MNFCSVTLTNQRYNNTFERMKLTVEHVLVPLLILIRFVMNCHNDIVPLLVNPFQVHRPCKVNHCVYVITKKHVDCNIKGIWSEQKE